MVTTYHIVCIVGPRQQVVVLRVPDINVDAIADAHELANVRRNGRVAPNLRPPPDASCLSFVCWPPCSDTAKAHFLTYRLTVQHLQDCCAVTAMV